jgi:hypothetical protein
MLKKLINLIEYLPTIGDNVHIVGNEQEGTTALNTAVLDGRQIVAVLPLAILEGNCDSMTGAHVPMIFVLEKTPTTSDTPVRAQARYIECARQLEAILEKIAADITLGSGGRPCPLLTGFDLQGVRIIPEANVFGGWSGFSATITLR